MRTELGERVAGPGVARDPAEEALDARWRALGAGESLFHALGAGEMDRVSQLLPRSDVRLAPLLEHAADCGQVELVRWLLSIEAATLLPEGKMVPQVSDHRCLSDLLFAFAAVHRLGATGSLDDILDPVARLTLDEVRAAVRNDPALRNARNWLGHTLLHSAAATADPVLVELLLDLGLDVRAADEMGHTPLAAVANRVFNRGLKPYNDGVIAARLLIVGGADVNGRSGVAGQTPLHMAARRGNVELGRLLMSCGADVHARSAKGDTPLRRAQNCRQAAFVDLLREDGPG
ncbi:MAG TPA: ankyrin repeat domain-containing protein [Chloroflexota bacterium]|nr:ankyrin repeat domain-containing protein [Chloroflexota bacterium]